VEVRCISPSTAQSLWLTLLSALMAFCVINTVGCVLRSTPQPPPPPRHPLPLRVLLLLKAQALVCCIVQPIDSVLYLLTLMSKASEYAIIFGNINPFLTLRTSQSASTQILKSVI